MDIFEYLKASWPYVAALAAGGFALWKYREQVKADKLKAGVEAEAKLEKERARQSETANVAAKLAQEIVKDTLESLRKEVTEARIRLAANWEQEILLRRSLDKKDHEIEGLKKERETLVARVADLEATIERLKERHQLHVEQLEGELRQTKQVIESGRRQARRD